VRPATVPRFELGPASTVRGRSHCMGRKSDSAARTYGRAKTRPTCCMPLQQQCPDDGRESNNGGDRRRTDGRMDGESGPDGWMETAMMKMKHGWTEPLQKWAREAGRAEARHVPPSTANTPPRLFWRLSTVRSVYPAVSFPCR
jgi:hypothetical protein